MTVAAIERCMLRMLMARDGVIQALDDMDQENLPALQQHYAGKRRWTRFKHWVKQNCPPEEHLAVRALKPRLLREIKACTPAVVVNNFDGIEDCMIRCGIIAARGEAISAEGVVCAIW